jgi:hypothetical protein
MDYEEQIFLRYRNLSPSLNERTLRLFAASEAQVAGYGGVTLVHKATGLARSTITRGLKELDEQSCDSDPKSDSIRIRKDGGGRHSITEIYPDILEALNQLVEPTSKGDPCKSLRWSLKSSRALAIELRVQGYIVSHTTIKNLLNELGYSLQANKKTLSPKKQHPDRNAQFEHINETIIKEFDKDNPVISVDTKKKKF